MKKENKGITLVALVITIIVLLILAGVSINAIQNGGIIKNATDAKDKYEKGKQEEEQLISKLEIDEVQIEFFSKGVPYSFKNGYLTGVNVTNGVTETVASLRKKLPEGYEIYEEKEENDEIKIIKINPEDTTTLVKNGMIIKKIVEGEEKQVGRVIVFGDLNSSGEIESLDNVFWSGFFSATAEQVDKEYKDYEKVAMDVNHDKVIDCNDLGVILGALGGKDIVQGAYANSLKDLRIKTPNKVKEEILNYEPLKKSSYSLGYNEEYEVDCFEGIIEGKTTINDILNVLPVGYEYVVMDENTGEEITDTSQKIQDMFSFGIKGMFWNSNEIYYIALVVI